MPQSEFKFLVLLKRVRKTKFVSQFHEFASNVRDFLTQFIFSRMFHYLPPEPFQFNNITNAIFGNSFIYASSSLRPSWALTFNHLCHLFWTLQVLPTPRGEEKFTRLTCPTRWGPGPVEVPHAVGPGSRRPGLLNIRAIYSGPFRSFHLHAVKKHLPG